MSVPVSAIFSVFVVDEANCHALFPHISVIGLKAQILCIVFENKCSDRSMEVQLPALLGNYDSPTA